MKKRLIALLLASCVLVSTTVYCPIEVQATVAAVAEITWSEEMLYSFELFLNSVGVRVSSKAVPGIALAWEAQARVEDPGFLDELAEKTKNTTWWGQDSEDYNGSMCNQWITSIRDFLTSDACTDYGTANFSFGTNVTSQVLSSLGLGDAPYLLETVSEYFKGNVYYGLPPDSAKNADSPGFLEFLALEECDNYIIQVGNFPNGKPYINLVYIVSGDVAVYPKKITFKATGECNPIGSNILGLNKKITFEAGTSSSPRSYYVSPGMIFTFPSDASLSDYIVEDPLANFVFADSFPDVQAKGLLGVPSLSDIFTIPATAKEREAVLSDVRGADTSEALAKVLAGAGITIFPKSDVDTDHDIDVDINDESGAIVKALAALQTSIKSIPAQITDFFTVDLKAISGAYDGLLGAFDSRFPLMKQLASIFAFNGNGFDQTPPVFTMKIPDCLRFAYPNDNEIIILDLRTYASYFAMFRVIVNACLWLMFANWLLNEFDIDLHVG